MTKDRPTPEEIAYVSQCVLCAHWWGRGRCAAFPDGVPDVIQTENRIHDAPRPDLGQRNKIVWERREPQA